MFVLLQTEALKLVSIYMRIFYVLYFMQTEALKLAEALKLVTIRFLKIN